MPVTTQDSASTTTLPDWYTNYGATVTGIGASMLPNWTTNYQGAVGANGQPLPRVAGLDPAQTQAYDKVLGSQGAWQGDYNNAMGVMNSGVGALSQAGGFYDQAGNIINGGTGYIGAASGDFDNAGNYIGRASGDFDSAGNYIGQASNDFGMADDAIGSATGNFDQGQGMIGDAGGHFDAAGNYIRSASNNFGVAGDNFNNANGTFKDAISQANSGRPLIGAGAGALTMAGNILVPGVGSAIQGGSTVLDPGNQELRDAWMNPYTDRVAGTIARLGNQNLMENVIPGINSTFVGSGQFGSSRNSDFMNHAIRDNQQTISDAQAKMLLDAQNNADQMYSAEKGRQLTAGQVLGGLSQVGTGIGTAFGNLANANTNIADALNQSGAGLTNVGIGQTNLGSAVVNQGNAERAIGDSQVNQGTAMANIGAQRVAQGNAYSNVGANRVVQGNAMTNVGNARVNQGNASTNVGLGRVSQGNAMTNAGQAMTGVGNGYVNMGSAMGNIGSNMGALTQMGNNMRLNDINALLTVGGMNQKQNQAGIDAALTDFYDRRDFPMQALTNLGGISNTIGNTVPRGTRNSSVNQGFGDGGSPTDIYGQIQDIINIINGGAK